MNDTPSERPALRRKKAQVEEMKEEFSSSQNIAVIDLRKLPDRLLQNVRKKLREKDTKIRVAQATVLRRALESSGKPKRLIDLFENPAAVVLTGLSPYELNKFFSDNTMDVAAKPGQVAPSDIVVPAGETSLPPGPALSELKAAGINAQIRGPKISVAKDSTVVKAGEVITTEKAKALQTLGFKPFKVNVNILLAYDGEYVYAPDLLGISAETLAPQFMDSLQGAFNVSVNAGYPTAQNVEVLLVEALSQGRNAGINGGIYSPQSIEQLLIRSIRGGMALSENLPDEPAKEAAPAAAGEQKAQKPDEPEAGETPGASTGEAKEPEAGAPKQEPEELRAEEKQKAEEKSEAKKEE